MRGYHHGPRGQRRSHWSPAVVKGDIPPLGGQIFLSFLDLYEVRCVDEFRKRGVAWTTIRVAYDRAAEEFGTHHPFSTGRFVTLGQRILLETARGEDDYHLIDIARDQSTFGRMLRPFVKSVDFVKDRAAVWWPLPGSQRVVIDPRRSFGEPIVDKRGVPTRVLAQAVKAEGSIARVARWYEVDHWSVRDAVRYEDLLEAA